MRRRAFIEGIAASAAAWPVAARAQQGVRVRRVGVLMNKAADDPEGRREVSAFEAALQKSGWILGANVQIDYRWGAGDSSRYLIYATELRNGLNGRQFTDAGDILQAQTRRLEAAADVRSDAPVVHIRVRFRG